jgi:hypothetical protein
MQQLYTTHKAKYVQHIGRCRAALELQGRLQPLLSAIFKTTPPQPPREGKNAGSIISLENFKYA